MQFKVLAVSAFAAFAVASENINTISVLSVLETALPSSLLAEALTNSPAVVSQVESEFNAGTTPTWFKALPTPIQTYLLSSNGTVPNATAIHGKNSTAKHTTNTAGKTTKHPVTVPHHTTGMHTSNAAASSSSSAASAASSSSTGGAPLPTALVGAGLAGVVGVVGLFAL